MRAEAWSALLEARALTEAVTPLRTDCGRVCGGACCQPDETGRGGMLLFPGEEALYRERPGYTVTADPTPGAPGLLLTCSGACRREERPLSCRIFPLLPVERSGRIAVVRDRRGFEVCPLLPSGLGAFQPAFIEAVRAAGTVLYRVEEHRVFLTQLHRLIAEFASLTGGRHEGSADGMCV